MKRYLITDPSLYGDDATTFCKTLKENFSKRKADFICLRDKKTSNYEALATAFVPFVKSLQVKPILHTDFLLASKLNAYGVHLPSSAYEDIKKAKKLGLHVIISTHTKEEAARAQTLGADAITFSPIFDTPNKGKPVGLEKLKEILDTISINCYALGGIVTQKHIKACEDVGAFGFASIRYFCP